MTGPTGTGKTTLGRIAAQSYTCSDTDEDGKPCFKCVSCRYFTELGPGHHPDVLEVNCGSDTGIDVIRSIQVTAASNPVIGRHRVIFLDEVHRLSEAAKQAAFKLIEEPRAKTRFILGSMEPEKFTSQVGKAIKNRTLHVVMQKPSVKEIVDRLRDIAALKGQEVSDQVLGMIAGQADCMLRESISYLDVALSSGDTRIMTASEDEADVFVSTLTGGSPYKVASTIVESIYRKDIKSALEAATAVNDKVWLLKLIVEQSSNIIKCRYNPQLVDNPYGRRVAIGIAKSTKLETIHIATIGKKIMEAQRLVSEYTVNAEDALTHVLASIWNQ
jgi:DNA polymerase-3 subunit gamma/tau